MPDGCVVNASPLIFLARGGHLGLLRTMGGPVLVPRPVADEIRHRGSSDATARGLAASAWLTIVEASAAPAQVLGWALGPITVALATPGLLAVIDDMAGRKCASASGVSVIGTLGVVLRARRQGLIAAARPVLEDLVAGGMYLSRDVLDRSLALVGE